MKATWPNRTMMLAAGLLAAVGGCGGYQGPSTGANRPPPAPPAPRRAGDSTIRWLSPMEAFEEIRTHPNLFLLCVARKEEYDGGHIAGSVLIPVAALPSRIRSNDLYPEINRGRAPRKNQLILCYCWWKACDCPGVPTYTDIAAKVLVEKGFRNIALLDGGMRAWVRARLPVEKASKTPETAARGAFGP